MNDRNRIVRAGFTLVELMVVLVLMLVAAAIAVPNTLNAIYAYRLRGAASDAASIFQAARIRAVQDDRFYSVYPLAATSTTPEEVYVDIYPQSATGASGTGGTSVKAGDPLIAMSSEVTPEALANAPNAANLKSQFLPTGSTLVPGDGSVATSPVTFSPRGLACTSQTVTGGTICDSGGGPTAFWIFFQDNRSQAWEAVTITPAGRVQKWIYSGTSSSGGWTAL